MPQPERIIILSGEIGCGKSTICLKVVEKLKATSLDVAGVICPPIFDGQNKTGIDLLDLRSSEMRHLARLNLHDADGIQTHRWIFNEDTLRWGNALLGLTTPCNVLIIDELGPLEFDRGLGFTNALTALDAGNFAYALVVIRPSLLEKARSRWPSCQVIEVTPENRNTHATELVKQIAS